MDEKNPAEPFGTRDFGISRNNLEWVLVEAAGIEPASENIPRATSTGIDPV